MPGGYLEGFFKPELDRIMNELKAKDDHVRAILTGKKIGTAEAPKDGKSAKDLLKSARTNLNRREYMTGIFDLGLFHKKMLEVATLLNDFKVDVNKIHHKFLFQGVSDERLKEFQEHMRSLPEVRKAELYSQNLIKTAGIIDDIMNIATKRGRSLLAWEKKYPKETKDLREGAFHLLDESQRLLDNTISYLKEMATARAIRRPDDFLEASQKIISEFNKFDTGDKGFRSFYGGPVKKWLDIKEKIDARQQATQQAPAQELTGLPQVEKRELGEPPAPAAPAAPAAPPSPSVTLSPNVQSVPWSPTKPTSQTGTWLTVPMSGPPGSSPPFSPPPPSEGPITERKPQTFEKPASSHREFFETLITMSGEDPRILSSFIAKYAKSIQDTDLETAIKLFSIVKRLKG